MTTADVINIKYAPYYAKGDGATDDTAAIQAALNFTMGGNPTSPGFNPLTNTGSYTIYFPPGNYKITKSLTWTGNYGNALKIVGHNAGEQYGSWLYWYGGAGGFYTTITSGSNGQSLPQATINVVSTAGFAASGTILVITSGGQQTVTYTGTTATTFTGCSGGAGSMSTGNTVVGGVANTLASGSNGQTLPQSVINVVSTAGFPTTGSFYVTTSDVPQKVNYTGLTSTSFTGCTSTAGTASFVTGAAVVYMPIMWEFYSANSCVFEHMGFNGLANANTLLWFHTHDPQTAIASGSNGQSLPQATINVQNASNFYAPGTLSVTTGGGVQTVSYTGVTPTSFTGCTGGTGTMSTGGAVVGTLTDSFNNEFHHCFITNVSGCTADDGTGAVCVKCGDNNVTTAVGEFEWHFCTFQGQGVNDGQTFALVQPLQHRVGNTETFFFYDCQMSVAQYCFFFLFANNQCGFYNVQCGGFSKAFVFVDGSSEVMITGGGCENGIQSGPYAHQGFFTQQSFEDSVHIDSCEIIMDAFGNVFSGSTPGAMFYNNGGRLLITNSIIDASQSGGGVPGTVPSIVVGNIQRGGFSPATIIVEQCEIANTDLSGHQFLIQDTGGTNFTSGPTGQIVGCAIHMRGNTGNTVGSTDFTQIPDFDGQPTTIFSLGPENNAVTTPYFGLKPVYQSEVRQSVTCFEIDYTNAVFGAASTVVNLIPFNWLQRTIVVRCIVEVVTPFKGGSISAMAMSVGEYQNSAPQQYIQSFDCWTAPIIRGLADGDLGIGLARATAVQGGDLTFWAVAPASNTAVINFTATGANFSAGTTTTIASGSNGQFLPQGTIHVVSTAGFASSGTIFIATSYGQQVVTYSGTSGGNQFTGCSGGTGTMLTGGTVTVSNLTQGKALIYFTTEYVGYP
jgi:hypothetical protein